MYLCKLEERTLQLSKDLEVADELLLSLIIKYFNQVIYINLY